MRYGARRLLSLLAVLVMVSLLVVAPMAAAAETTPPLGGPSREVDVTVTPPQDITFGQIPGDPSAEQADKGSGTDESGTFTYRYVGVDGTDYDSGKKPLGAGKYQVVATLSSATHSGEGVSVPFTIRRTAGGAKRTVTVPTTGGSRTVYISELGLYSGMVKGASIQKMSTVRSGNVLESAGVGADRTSFELNMKPAQDGKSQTFQLVLESDNYEELTVTVTVTASVNADDLEISNLKVKEPGTFEYGTALKDIIDLEDCTAVLNGQSVSGTFALLEPERCYSVGEDTKIALRFASGGKEYTRTVSAGFTIEPVSVTFLGWDEAFIRDGYWITTYANSPYNVSLETLRELVQDRKESFTVSRGRRRIGLDAVWSTDGSNPSFELQGQKPHQAGDVIWYDWYAYTATLTSRSIDVKNLSAGGVQPKAYIRVVPVIAATDLGGGSSKTVSAAGIAALTEENWKTVLGLPETAAVTYEPAERPEWSDEYIPTPDGTYAISGWQMDGEDLTLAVLKTKAAAAVSGEVKVTLTPVYAGVPAWAVIAATPPVELTITPDEIAEP